MQNDVIIAWWSAGITSAVACKIAIEKYGKDKVIPCYIHIDSAHNDNSRFLDECQNWYGREIEVYKSSEYADQYDVIEKTKYVNGAAGARCTEELKKKVRRKVEEKYTRNLFQPIQWTNQIFGFEYEPKQINRAIRFAEQYTYTNPIYPLIEFGINKNHSSGIIINQNIELPAMYKLGYSNNNCIGCVKGGKGYWNKIRVDFPDRFQKMAELERLVGHSCIKGVFLDELNPKDGRETDLIMPECGSFCQIEFADLPSKYLVSILKGEMQINEVVARVAA